MTTNKESALFRHRISGRATLAALLACAPPAISRAQAQTGAFRAKALRAAAQIPAVPDTGAAVSDSRAVQMLRRMIQAEHNQAYSAQEATFEPGRSTEEVVKHDPKRGMRRESVRPAGEIFIDNYARSWLVSTRSRTITERSSLAKRTEGGDAVKRLLKQKLPVSLVGEEKVAGRVTDIVSVSVSVSGNNPQGQASRRFWIDRKTGLRLRSEDRGPGGRILASTYYLSVDMNPSFGPDDFSRPVAPPDFKTLTEDRHTFHSYDEALRAGILIRRPAYLPAGFRLRSIEVVRKSGGRQPEQRISQRFDNGLSALTLVQSDVLALGKRSLTTENGDFLSLPRGQRAYLWRDKATKLTFALLGSLPDDELKRIADSAK